jgi:hypothetical protein
MSKEDLDQLRLACKKAVDGWVDTIRAEEALVSPDHSIDRDEARRTHEGYGSARSLQRRA